MPDDPNLIAEVWRRLSAMERWWLVVLTSAGGAIVAISSSLAPGWSQDAMLGLGSATVLAVPLLLIGLIVQRGVTEAERAAEAARSEAKRATSQLSDVHDTTVRLAGVVERLVERTAALERERQATGLVHGDLWIEVVAVLDEMQRSGRVSRDGLRIPLPLDGDHHLRLRRADCGVVLSVEGPSIATPPCATHIWQREDDLPELLADLARTLNVKGVELRESRHLLPGLVRWAEKAKRLAAAEAGTVPPLVVQDLDGGSYVTDRGLARPADELVIEVPDLEAALDDPPPGVRRDDVARARRVLGLDEPSRDAARQEA